MQLLSFKLDKALPFLNVEATTCQFRLEYPNGKAYWELQTDEGKALKIGNYDFPETVLAKWTTTDDVLIAHLKKEQPWLYSGEYR